MAKRIDNRSDESKTLDQILTVTQQAFILQALQAGIATKSVQKILKIDYLRVIEISKYLKEANKKLRTES